jgi:hypothetical protein
MEHYFKITISKSYQKSYVDLPKVGLMIITRD